MTERQLQFRVGLFVIFAMMLASVMVFQFGNLKSLWEQHYTIAIHFPAAPGVRPQTPVQRNGVTIGSVREVLFDEQRGGVLVLVDIQERHQLRADAQAQLVRSLLGDATIQFTPGRSPERLTTGARLDGEPPVDPLEIIDVLEERMTQTLDSFAQTSNEWQRVGRNVNGLLETNEGNFHVVLERTAEALTQFTRTMEKANFTLNEAGKILADPAHQQDLKRTLAALPELVDETRQTIVTVRTAVHQIEQNMETLNKITLPMAKSSPELVLKLDRTLHNLESITGEVNEFSRAINRKDGSLQKLVSDPDLYRNLNMSAGSLAILLKNLEPMMRDLRIFSDKIARHPELMGVSGALNGSSGLKDGPEDDPAPQNFDAAGRSRFQRN